MAAGFLLVGRVFRENSFTSATIEVAEGQTVISTGPYAVVRHPMYAGALLYLLATPVALGSYWGLLPFAIIVVGLLFADPRRGAVAGVQPARLPGVRVASALPARAGPW